MNDYVRRGKIEAPIVIGRDHLDAGSVASPYRETEAMRDGSDAIADWPLLNALRQHRGGRVLGVHSQRRRRRHRIRAARRNGGGGRRHRTPARGAWSACSPPIPAWASFVTPTPDMPRPSKSRTSTASASRWILHGSELVRTVVRLLATGDARRPGAVPRTGACNARSRASFADGAMLIEDGRIDHVGHARGNRAVIGAAIR